MSKHRCFLLRITKNDLYLIKMKARRILLLTFTDYFLFAQKVRYIWATDSSSTNKMCRITNMQTVVMYFNVVTGKRFFIREIAISPTKYTISTIALYAILESNIWNKDSCFPSTNLYCALFESVSFKHCMFLLSADTKIVMIATEKEIKIATIFICVSINSEKLNMTFSELSL